MKKLLALALLLGSSFVFVSSTEAKTTNTPNTVNSGNSANIAEFAGQPRRRRRSYITTRTVRRGWRWYRETYRITYLPNGRVRTQLIRRVRIR
jgi:hypothetical protein